MTKRELFLKNISTTFAVWEVNLSNNGSLNLVDGNVIFEDIILELLNIVFDYSLHNVNADRKNHVAIDLGDKKNRVAFQITSTRTAKKIQDTVDAFFRTDMQAFYDDLYIFILGKKQRSYASVFVPETMPNFHPSRNILDFRDLLRQISNLPLKKIEALHSVINHSHQLQKEKPKKSLAFLQKKNLALKKRLQKDLLRQLPPEHYERAFYEPWFKFRYSSVIIRETGDRTFPGGDPKNPKWLKVEFWDFYEYGIELVRGDRTIIMDSEGNWDFADYADPRTENPSYKRLNCHVFYRLAFENIDTYDMEPDGYYGYPTIYCDFRHDGWPYEEILWGLLGTYSMKRMVQYLPENMRKKLP